MKEMKRKDVTVTFQLHDKGHLNNQILDGMKKNIRAKGRGCEKPESIQKNKQTFRLDRQHLSISDADAVEEGCI